MRWFDLPSGASHEEIRREYKKLAKLYHPDRSAPHDRARATLDFQELSDAYMRRMESGPPCPSQSDDFFEGIKLACFKRFPSPKVAAFPCTLEELYTGGLKGFEWRAVGSPPQLVQVLLPPGTRHATKLLVPGAVRATPKSVSIDLLLIVIEIKHPRFDRRVDDLHTSQKLSRDEALIGWTHPVTLLDGSLLHVEHGPMTEPQARVVIPGAGMPSKSADHRGDLIVTFDVITEGPSTQHAVHELPDVPLPACVVPRRHPFPALSSALLCSSTGRWSKGRAERDPVPGAVEEMPAGDVALVSR